MVVHYFPTIQTSSFAGLDSYVTNGETRVYIPAGVTPVCGVDLTDPSTGGIYQCAISGYLVDAPLAGPSGGGPAQHHQSAPAPLIRNPGTGR
jgi:hypothetical protein